MTGRKPLPPRRQCLRYRFTHAGFRYFGTIGIDPKSGNPAEVFLQSGKAGTAIEAIGRDAAVLASIALQYGAPMGVLRHALTRLEGGEPAGAIAALLDRFARDYPDEPVTPANGG